MILSSRQEKPVVIDASVVLKWQFDDEECISQALALRDDFYLHGIVRALAPQLLSYELANGIVVAARRKRVPAEKAIESMSNLLQFGIELCDIEPLSVIEASLRYAISAYDAAYVSLACSEKCELWTGDKALYQAVSKALPSVKWIGDYPVNRSS